MVSLRAEKNLRRKVVKAEKNSKQQAPTAALLGLVTSVWSDLFLMGTCGRHHHLQFADEKQKLREAVQTNMWHNSALEAPLSQEITVS